MRIYARQLFLLARLCGAAGLSGESLRLFELARQASGPDRAGGVDFRVYRAATAVLGWTFAGRIACWLDTARRTFGSPRS